MLVLLEQEKPIYSASYYNAKLQLYSTTDLYSIILGNLSSLALSCPIGGGMERSPPAS